ncbi:hypothetical protein GCM10010391_73280 [Streptomyces anthocyanicus]|nr:hypothetical protein GCM10010391_73280 [Streptomyces anthocyanicus]
MPGNSRLAAASSGGGARFARSPAPWRDFTSRQHGPGPVVPGASPFRAPARMAGSRRRTMTVGGRRTDGTVPAKVGRADGRRAVPGRAGKRGGAARRWRTR